MATEVVSRADAKAKGLARYFTGKPCKHGHVAERRTINGLCVECGKRIEKKWVEANRDKVRAKWRNYEQNASAYRRAQHSAANKTYAAKNRTQIDERINRWKAANPELVKTYGKRWRDRNKDRIRIKNRRYKTEHAERLAPANRARVKQWAKDNPDRKRAQARRGRRIRRARILNVGGSHTEAEIAALLVRQNFLCAAPHCRKSLKAVRHLDHIVALARGGSNDIANLQWLCPDCNRDKRDKDWNEWLAECAAKIERNQNGLRP